ncbi:MAG: aromatic amino acid ammonia-lyase [Bdellovibrionota bacterium]
MPSKIFEVGHKRLTLGELNKFIFSRSQFSELKLSQDAQDRILKSHHQLLAILEEKKALYGVTTGLGDSCHRYIEPECSAELALNLVRYLGCGTGAVLSQDICRAVLAIHFVTLSQGFSAVSPALMEHMKVFIENDWCPVIPREGSLGASGDLVPLSYLARAFIGEADVYTSEGDIQPSAKLMKEKGIKPYKLKSKEGLSLVNGVSTMAGHMLINLQDIEFLAETATLTTSWLCIALGGRKEAFGSVINKDAKSHTGQSLVAEKVTQYLN